MSDPPSPSSPTQHPHMSARHLKRRVTSPLDLSFFTPAASSFQPVPYAPKTRSLSTSYKSTKGYPISRALSQEALTIAGMDPSPGDPGTRFLSPPFKDISQLKGDPHGLTYNVLAQNPEWFLVPSDYIRFDVTDPDAILYPTELEPPRGWCPAKKKDLHQRGAEGWPEGEEPRLRCTFCRRTYAGVNAKSMWRRHVYEKHKVAMENRVRPRGMAVESIVRPRGRGANKENKVTAPRPHNYGPMESIVNIEVQPQLAADSSHGLTLKSKFRSSSAAEPDESSTEHKGNLSPYRIDFGTENNIPHPLSQSTLPPLSPPPTPSRSRISTPCPSSPYDPLATPSFRHSPARLPSDKPWRFSPGHPLYSRTREIMLTTLMPPVPSPLTGMKHSLVDDSPVVNARKEKQRLFELNTPDSTDRMKSTPFRSLFKSRSFTSTHDKDSLDVSPFTRSNVSQPLRKGLSSITSIDDWLSDNSTSFNTKSPRVLLKGNDLFADVWTPVKDTGFDSSVSNSSPIHPGMIFRSPPLSTSGTESPVLRCPESARIHSSLKPSGLGIGLMEAFTLSKGEEESEPKFMSSLRVDRVDDCESENSGRSAKASRSTSDRPSPDDRPSKKRRSY